MALLSLQVFGVGIFIVCCLAGVSIGSQLNRLLRIHEPKEYIRLGSPTGFSPPDPSYGTVEFQRYILNKEYLQSNHLGIRTYGAHLRWLLVAALVAFCFSFLILIARVVENA